MRMTLSPNLYGSFLRVTLNQQTHTAIACSCSSPNKQYNHQSETRFFKFFLRMSAFYYFNVQDTTTRQKLVSQLVIAFGVPRTTKAKSGPHKAKQCANFQHVVFNTATGINTKKIKHFDFAECHCSVEDQVEMPPPPQRSSLEIFKLDLCEGGSIISTGSSTVTASLVFNPFRVFYLSVRLSLC